MTNDCIEEYLRSAKMIDTSHEDGTRLATAIAESGLTKQEIAQLAGMHPTALTHVLHGRRNATVEQRVRLSRVLRRRIADLFEPSKLQGRRQPRGELA